MSLPTEGAARVRVRYCECDPMGVAHHAAYAPWLELARTELLRAGGFTYADLERSGVFLVVTRLECRFHRPVYYDEVIEIRVRARARGRVRIDHDYEVVLVEPSAPREDDRTPDRALTSASTTLACVGRDGQVRPLPEALAAPPSPGKP